jgi:hypothetical protein
MDVIRSVVDTEGKVLSVAGPEQLMALAADGHLSKQALANLLVRDQRRAFLEACTAIEKKYTHDCTANDEPCLASGCAVEGEACLQPLVRAGGDYYKAVAAEWAKFFANPKNRVDAWKH